MATKSAEEEQMSHSRGESEEKDEDEPWFAFAPDYRRDSAAADDTREVVQRFLVTKDRSTWATGARTKYLEVLVDGTVRVRDPKEARPDGIIKDPLKFFSGKDDPGPRVSVNYAKKQRSYKFSTAEEKLNFFAQLDKLKSATTSRRSGGSNKYATETFYFVPEEVEVFFINDAVVRRLGSQNVYSDKLVAITNYRMVVVDTHGRSYQSSIKNGDTIVSALTVEHASVREFAIDGDSVVFSTNDLRTLSLDLSGIDTPLLKTQCMNILKKQMQPLTDPRDVFAFEGWYSALRALKMKGPRTPLTSISTSEFPSVGSISAMSPSVPASGSVGTPKHSKSSTMKAAWSKIMTTKQAAGSDDEEEAAEVSKKKVVIEKVSEPALSELWRLLGHSRRSNEDRRRAMMEEYKRLGFQEGDPSCKYRVSTANKDWSICESYPPFLLVPATASDDLLRKAATHRSSNRLVSITWANRKNVTMSRCSQPCAGLGSAKKNDEDELLIQMLNNMNDHSDSFFICDCRPKKNAMANAIFKGKGFEGDTYASSHIMFFDIENIHVMRHSLAALKKCCEDQHSSNWLSSLSGSGYLQHLSKILQCANKVANMIDHDKISVLVHCSDGWDRTAQVCALSQVLLDGHYRKFRGFLLLIQKEWLWFGHKCSDRNGNFGLYGVPRHKPKERSPIFLQFLDCVYQTMIQYPWAFEFTPELLLQLMKHYSSGRFGDFLCNCEREREEMELWIQTPSLFKYLEDRWEGALEPSDADSTPATFHNASYIPTQRVLKPRSYVRDLKLWDELYCRFTMHDKDRRAISSTKATLARYFYSPSPGHRQRMASPGSLSTSSIGGSVPFISTSLRHKGGASMPSVGPLHKIGHRRPAVPPKKRTVPDISSAIDSAADQSSSEETPMHEESPPASRPPVTPETVDELLAKVKRLESMLEGCKCRASPLKISVYSDGPFVGESVEPEIVSPSAAEDDYFLTSISSVV